MIHVCDVFQAELSPPTGASLDTIRSLLTRMQKVYAPREKLEALLATISHIYQAVSSTFFILNFIVDKQVPT